jgi:glutathione-regulated potassium-efflux system ancillary protein KefC/glutathione-regulated potassium-efflux system protein KefB
MTIFLEAIVYLSAAIIAVPISKRLGFGSVLGYLAAGIVIGPYGVGLISNAEHILHFAEFGVVFLLFIIGLELQPSRLWILRRMVFGLGSAQVILSTLFIGLIASMLGLAPVPAGVVGAILALSSTAFVLQMLAEKKQLTTSHGRAAFTILLFQDLAVIPLIALLPLIGNTTSTNFSYMSVVSMVGSIGGLIIGGHYLLRPVLRVVARTGIPELFTAVALLVVFGAALLMQISGMSMVLGAFIAGMLLADSEYRHELEADIAPFKGLLLGLFFIAVGMTVNLELLAREPLIILMFVALLMSAKALVLFPLGRLFGIAGIGGQASLAATLCQGGEFAFVLFALAAQEKILEPHLIDQLILAVSASMMLTPFVYMISERLIDRMTKTPEPAYDEMVDDHHDVIIAGFGRVGQIIGRLLSIAKQPFTALEIDSSQVDVVRRYGNKVYYGDASKIDLLRAAGAGHAKIFVLAIDDMEASVNTAQTVSRHFPNLTIVARARNRRHEHKLMDLGITHIFRETFLSSVAVSKQVLTDLGMTEIDATHITDVFQVRDQQLLIEQHAVQHDEKKLIQSARETAAELASLLQEDLDQ